MGKGEHLTQLLELTTGSEAPTTLAAIQTRVAGDFLSSPGY